MSDLISKGNLLRELREMQKKAKQSRVEAFPHDRVQWEGVEQGIEASIQLVKKAESKQ
jgi:hypothetical protein